MPRGKNNPLNFSKRTNWDTAANPLAQKTETLRTHADFIDLTVSNPTACGFGYLKPDLLAPLADAQNLRYEPDARGLSDAREAIVRYYAAKGILLSPDQIFVTASTSEAYTFVFRTLLEPGAKILGPSPGYPLMDYLAEINDGALERYPLIYRKGWQIDRNALLKAGPAKARLVVHPSNPAGNYVRAEEQDFLQSWAAEKETAVISDEVFYDYAWQGAPAGPSFACCSQALTFTLSGISKILGLPQMKLSWIVVTGPQALRDEAIRRLEIVADTYLSASTPIQRALPAWMEQAPAIQREILARLQQNRDFLEKKLSGHPDIQILAAQGGWTSVLRLPSSQIDEAYALHLLEKAKVLTHPGYLYDLHDFPCLVVSLLIQPERFQNGIKRLEGLQKVPGSSLSHEPGTF